MLELKNVKKSYDGTPVLTDISLNIEDGEIVSILGPSGCGKTTLLNMILGIVDADGGKIIFNGEDMTNVPMVKRGFNIVFQDYALFPNLNVYQNITYGLRNNPQISSKEEVEEPEGGGANQKKYGEQRPVFALGGPAPREKGGVGFFSF